MGALRRYPASGLVPWTVLATSSYNAAAPAATTGAFSADADTFQAIALTDVASAVSHQGMLFTFTTAPAFLKGVRVSLAPQYTTGSPELEWWTKVGGAWTKQDTVVLTEVHTGVATGAWRIFELLLDTPLANVTHVWVTLDPAGSDGDAEWGTVHLYEWADETETDFFDPDYGALDDPSADLIAADSVTGDTYGLLRQGTAAGLGAFRAGLAYSLDPTPAADDEDLSDQVGAWMPLDLPVVHVAQCVDESGEDLIVVAIENVAASGAAHAHLYQLRVGQTRDEWEWDHWMAIYRRLSYAPLPSLPDTDNTESTERYALERIKRFRVFGFELMAAPTDALHQVRVTVQEFLQPATARTQTYTTARRNQVAIMVRGLHFSVLLEYGGNDDFRPHWWQGQWDVLGPRIRGNAVAS